MQISLMAIQISPRYIVEYEANYRKFKSKPFGWKYGVNKVYKNNRSGKESIKQYRGQLNKEMIKAKYSKQFPLDYLNELEAKYNAGQEVMFMKNGVTYFFKGFSDNDIMVKVVK